MSAARFAGLLVGASVALTACSVPIPEPSVTPSLEHPGGILEAQSDRILSSTFEALGAADAAADPQLLAGRVSGPAAAARAAEYIIAKNGGAVPDGITQDVLARYTTNSEAWPRTFVAVVKGSVATSSPVVLMWVSDGMHEEYELRWWARMVPGGVLPEVAPQETGADVLPLDASGYVITPGEAIASYAALLNVGSTPEAEAAFAPDPYRAQILADRATLSTRAGGRGGTYTETATAMTGEAFVLADLEGGALVFLPVELVADFNVPGAQLILPASDQALLSGALGSRVVYRYEGLVVLRVPQEGSGLLPAVVAADHHLVSVATS